jgi:hypothetical protein
MQVRIQSARLGSTSGLAGYLHGITPGLFLGGTWNLIDFTTRNTEGLNNNENFYLNSGDLLLSVKYLHPAGENWSFEFGGDLGMVSSSPCASISRPFSAEGSVQPTSGTSVPLPTRRDIH